jgi:hypothetical protein
MFVPMNLKWGFSARLYIFSSYMKLLGAGQEQADNWIWLGLKVCQVRTMQWEKGKEVRAICKGMTIKFNLFEEG